MIEATHLMFHRTEAILQKKGLLPAVLGAIKMGL